MKLNLKKIDGKKTGIFAAGVLFGTAGIKILSSRDARKVYTYCTAAVLRAKECVMKTPISRRMQKISMQKHSRSMKTELLNMMKSILQKQRLKKCQRKLQANK